MTGETAVRLKLSSVMTNANANGKIAAMMIKTVIAKMIRNLELVGKPEQENPALGRVFGSWCGNGR